MVRQFCDRCGADVTQKRSARVSIVADATRDGSGTVTGQADLCLACRRALEAWLAPAPRAKGKPRVYE